MWTFKSWQEDGKRLPLAHGTDSQVVHGCRETSSRNMTPYGSGSAEHRPLGFLPTGAPLAASPLPTGAHWFAPKRGWCPCHKHLYPTELANPEWSHLLGRGLQNKANTADTRESRSKVQTILGGNSEFLPVLSRPEYREARIQLKCQQRIVVPLRKQKASGGNRDSGLSFWLPSPGTCWLSLLHGFFSQEWKKARKGSWILQLLWLYCEQHPFWIVKNGFSCIHRTILSVSPQAGSCPSTIQAEVSNSTTWNYFNYGTVTFYCIE